MSLLKRFHCARLWKRIFSFHCLFPRTVCRVIATETPTLPLATNLSDIFFGWMLQTNSYTRKRCIRSCNVCVPVLPEIRHAKPKKDICPTRLTSSTSPQPARWIGVSCSKIIEITEDGKKFTSKKSKMHRMTQDLLNCSTADPRPLRQPLEALPNLMQLFRHRLNNAPGSIYTITQRICQTCCIQFFMNFET